MLSLRWVKRASLLPAGSRCHRGVPESALPSRRHPRTLGRRTRDSPEAIGAAPAHYRSLASTGISPQAVANTAGFHFGLIEQGGTSLYASLAQRVTNADALRILLSIGPTETMHFQTWQDKAGNAPPRPDPTTGLTFPDLNADGELLQTNLIMPEPTIFFDRKFPICSIIRPTQTDGAAVGAVHALAANGLFIGQSAEFFAAATALAQAADAARRLGP